MAAHVKMLGYNQSADRATSKAIVFVGRLTSM